MNEQFSDQMERVFEAQRELMHKFHIIERQNRPHLPAHSILTPEDFDTVEGQLRLKEYAWRILEEIGEAMETKSFDAYKEEVADAFHFLVELMILASIFPYNICERGLPNISSRDRPGPSWSAWTPTIMYLGASMHLLKNRPWKNKKSILDHSEFRKALIKVTEGFIWACHFTGISWFDLYDAYFAKSAINHSRIEAGV